VTTAFFVPATPPHNFAAEQAVLGAVLIKPGCFDEVAVRLVADDFYMPAHVEIFDAMLGIAKRKEPIDTITLAAEVRARDELRRLPDGEEYFLQLAASVPTAENVGHYVRLVWEASAIRQAIHFLAEAASRAYGNPPPGQFMREVRDGWAQLIAKLAKAGGKQPLKAVG